MLAWLALPACIGEPARLRLRRPEIFVYCQRHGCTGIPAIVDADRAAQLFGCVLHLPEIIGERPVKIDTGIPDPDHRALSYPDRFDVDAFVPGAVDRPV